MASLHLIERGANLFPAWLREDGIGSAGDGVCRPNLSLAAQRYLDRLGASVEDLFHHVLAVLHDPAYREANAGALAMEWPRIPLPGWPTPGNGAPGSAGVPPRGGPQTCDCPCGRDARVHGMRRFRGDPTCASP